MGRSSVAEVAAVFLRLGVVAFGGPAAHIAMMQEELVRRRRWLDDRRFLDLLSITNLIPGPNSTELAMHLGMERAGWRGWLAAGACFIVPAAVMVGVLAHAYTVYGRTPVAERLFEGALPVVLAIVVQALWSLGRTVFRPAARPAAAPAGGDRPEPGGRGVPVPVSRRQLATALRAGAAWSGAVRAGATRAAPALAILALYLAGVHELLLLLAAAALGGGAAALRHQPHHQSRQRPPRSTLAVGVLGTAGGPGLGSVLLAAAGTAPVPFSLGTLFLTFLKIGSVLYGSGYVLLAFLQRDFVQRLGWLTERQLLDAIAAGQFTPGPVFTTATFVGYVTGGWAGAAVATVAIFLPAFVFVAAIRPLADRLRRSPVLAAALDGLNVASFALMAGVTWQLARTAVFNLWTAGLFAGALLILGRTRLNSAWLIAAGAATGLFLPR
ncbi:chromate transporter [Thermaerobacter subterraneus]|uniref:Chromate transport protein ChrA n=1 Tax=Thermaerobacter subterraneus DSM 13965 TaxID=867903 RepID=K6QD81_9FIRM|nr:chromate transporter [Thermaerobacter subterraneus]EKP94591.1 chromate transport protein ChrA [Thermaerobacter subterraneus DSM 13965]